MPAARLAYRATGSQATRQRNRAHQLVQYRPLTAYEAVVREDAPAVYIRGDVSSGYLPDAFGHTNHVTTIGDAPVYGQAPLLSSDPGKSILLDGTNDYFSIAHDASLNFADVGTYEIWLQVLTRTGARTIIDKGTNSFQLGYDGTTKKFHMNANGLGSDLVTSAIHDDANTHHVVITKNGSARFMYVDGVDESILGTNKTCLNTVIALNIGREGTTFGEYSNIVWGHAAAYPTALSAARVLVHYNIGVGLVATTTAEVATATGSAYVIQASVAPTAPVSAATGAAANPSPSVAPTETLASGIGSAGAAAGSLGVNAGAVSATGTSPAASSSVAPTAGLSSGTGAAYNATASIGVAVFAGLAGATATAAGATGSIAPSGGFASGTGAALGDTTQVAVSAIVATATGTAFLVTLPASTTAHAGLAGATGVAYGVTDYDTRFPQPGRVVRVWRTKWGPGSYESVWGDLPLWEYDD